MPYGRLWTLSGRWERWPFPCYATLFLKSYLVGQHASYSRLFVLCSQALHCDHIRDQLEQITPQDIPPFVRELLAKCHVEMFVHGNVASAGAVQLAEAVAGAMGPGCCMDPDERRRDQCVVLPTAAEAAEAMAAAASAAATEVTGTTGEEAAQATAPPLDVGTVVPLLAKNPKEENAALEVYYQLAPATDPRDRAVLDLIDQILYEPCYDTLRTKQQLGYSVYSGTRLTGGVSGFCVQVVSARHPPERLDACVEGFLASMGPHIRGLSPSELSTHVGALVASKMQRDRNLTDEATRLWGHVTSTRYDFLSRELEVAALESVTVDEVYDMFVRYLLPPSSAAAAAAAPGAVSNGSGGGASTGQRRKLSVHIRPHGPLSAAKDKKDKKKKAEAEVEAADGAAAEAEAEAVAAAATAAPLPPMSEPVDLLSLRSRLPLHPLHLGTPPPPVMQQQQ